MRARRRRRKSSGNGLIVAGVIVFLMLVSAGGYYAYNAYRGDEPEKKREGNIITENQAEKLADPEEEMANEILDSMTLSDKIYQMMFVTPESITGVKTVVRAGETTKTAIENQPVGGIIYFTYNFQDREQTIEMISKSQEYSTIPLFIGVDEEGGSVARLGSNPEMGVREQPSMQSIGETGDPETAFGVGKAIAEDLCGLGFNVNFAPVADVIIDPNNTEIGGRSFGTEPSLVSDMVAKAVKGLEDNGVSAVLKHFPGHGSTTADSHDGYSESTRTIGELRSAEFVPFKAGIDAGADFVMVSHMTLTNATENNLPSSLSGEVITDMLKNELGFKGIIITDSFVMGAITKEFDAEDAVEKAISAGADMILMPSDVSTAHDAVMQAVKNGEISEERIDESVRKILKLKIEKGMIE